MVKNMGSPLSRRLLFCGLHPATLSNVTKPEMTHDFHSFNSTNELGSAGGGDDNDNDDNDYSDNFADDKWELVIGWSHSVAVNKETGNVKMLFTNGRRCLVGGDGGDGGDDSDSVGVAVAGKNKILSACFGFDLLYLLFADGSLRRFRVDDGGIWGGDDEANCVHRDASQIADSGAGSSKGRRPRTEESSDVDTISIMEDPADAASFHRVTISTRKYLKTPWNEKNEGTTSMAATDDGKLFIRWEKQEEEEVEKEAENTETVTKVDGKEETRKTKTRCVGFCDISDASMS